MSGVRLLDLYVLRRFLMALGLSVVGLVLVAVIIDLTENIDTFIDFQAGAALMGSYYLYRTPYWMILTLPVAGLLATLFSLTGLARRNEITAMKALGISLHRLLVPVFLCALVVSGLAFVCVDRLVPAATFRYNQVRDRITASSRQDGSRRQVLLQDVDGQMLYARSYDAQPRRALEPSYERRANDRLLMRADARELLWVGSGWIMVDGHVWRPGAGPATAVGGGQQAGPAVSRFDTLALASVTLRPEDLERLRKRPEEMSYAELRDYIRRAESNGEEVTRHRVDLMLKVAFPLTFLVIVALGAPLGANARQAGLANSFGLGTAVCFVFYGCVKAGQALGWNQVIDPWAGAWSANLVFGLASVVLLWRAHT